jgi:ribosomal protein L33
VIKNNRGGLYKSQTTIYDYWKIIDKDGKNYTIPKENDGLYNKIELNKFCFIAVNTDVIPNIILDSKYCN